MSENPTNTKSIAEHYPALKRIGFINRKKSVPFTQQLEWTDCGAASLCMVMEFHGKQVKLAEVRETMGIGRDGVSAKAILDTAEKYGLTGRGIKVNVEQVKLLKQATILHWEFNHFVVFDKIVKGGVRIVDPATGPRDVPMVEFAKQFTGVAIELLTTARFTKQKFEKGRLKRYVDELLSEKGLFSRVVVISLFLRLVALAMPLVTGMIIDKVVPRSDYSLLYVCLATIAGMTVFNIISEVVRSFVLLHLRIALDTRMTLGFLDHMVSLPYSFFQRRSTGDLMMRVDSNGTVREIVTSKSMSAVLDGVFVLLYAGVIFYVNPLLGIITILMSAAEALVFLCARPTYQRLLAADLDKQAKAHSYMVQLLGGIETLKCAGAERLGLEKWSNLYTDEVNVKMQRARVSSYVDSIRGAVASLGPMLILTIGATSVMSDKLTIGTMLAMNSLATSLFGPLSALVSSALELQLVKGHMDRIDDVLQTEVEQDRDKVIQPPRLRGHVTVKNLSFKYGEQAPLVVQNVSLEIPPGASVALVGPSGSGKSTLLNILSGLYKPVSGEVHYDAKPLHDMDLRAVRQQIGIVPQHPFIFGGTMRENIALASPGATLDRIQHAAKVACLHDDIAEMPMNYDTIISDGGGSLSGGQRQRVAIARAVLRNPTLMLLDEATSALDNTTEKKVSAGLETLRCTRITVAHRLSTIRNCDLIVVMEKGKVIEQGNHDQLVAKGGLYATLLAASQGTTPMLQRFHMKLPMLFTVLLAACGSHEPPKNEANWPFKAPKNLAVAKHAALLELNAVVTSRTSHVITAESDGTVMSLNARTDEYVHLGQQIAQIDVQELRSKRGEAEGQLINAQGQAGRAGALAAAASRKAKIQQRLARVGAASPEEVKAAFADASAAGSEGAGTAGTIKQAKTQIAEMDRLIEAANIKAPMDGTIAVIKVRVGDMARRGQAIARVFDPADPIVKFALPHDKQSAVKVGDSIPMYVGDASVNATVTQIIDDHDPAIDFFTVVAELDKKVPHSPDIKVGATGFVRVADKGAVR